MLFWLKCTQNIWVGTAHNHVLILLWYSLSQSFIFLTFFTLVWALKTLCGQFSEMRNRMPRPWPHPNPPVTSRQKEPGPHSYVHPLERLWSALCLTLYLETGCNGRPFMGQITFMVWPSDHDDPQMPPIQEETPGQTLHMLLRFFLLAGLGMLWGIPEGSVWK